VSEILLGWPESTYYGEAEGLCTRISKVFSSLSGCTTPREYSDVDDPIH